MRDDVIGAVMILRGQSLDDDQLPGLGRLFGEIEPPRNRRLAPAEAAGALPISPISTSTTGCAQAMITAASTLGNRLWHAHASLRDVPGALSMLFAHVVPPVDGKTEFADLRAVYDALAADIKARIDGRVAEHAIFRSRASSGSPTIPRPNRTTRGV